MRQRTSTRGASRRRQIARRRWAFVGGLLGVIVVLVVWLTSGSPRHPKSAEANARPASGSGLSDAPRHFVVRRLPFLLPSALQDAAAVALGSGQVVLLGGLDASDTSTDAVTVLGDAGFKAGGLLPQAQHDAQGAIVDGHVYLFGGGQYSSYSHILSYDPQTERVTQVASLPTPTSDAGVATIAGTAYVVGGYDGEQALNTIVAWRPGTPAQVVARLPYGLRYAAVAASDGRLVIAGGSREEAATSAVLSFDPTTRALRRIGGLPAPITHASAVALGSWVYLLGGRGSASGSQSASILAIDPHRTLAARRLTAARAVGWVGGGRRGTGVAGRRPQLRRNV